MSIKISELPVASSVNSADIVPIVQDGTTKQARAEMIKPQIETVINSSSTNDKPVGAKAVYDYSAPKKHDSETQEYGVATTTKYGHTKIIDSLDRSSYQVGESLSAYQGAVLKQSIDNINDNIENITDELATKQAISNMTDILDENSTNAQYPNAQVTYEKYNELLNQIPTNEVSGNPINVQDSSNLPIKDFALLGNATQESFTLLDYIESTGSEWIDTNYYLLSNQLKIQTKVYVSDMPTSERDIISNQDNQTKRFALGLYSSKVFGYSRDRTYNDTNVFSSIYSGAQTLEIEAIYDKANSTKTLTVNGTTTTETMNAEICNYNKTIKLLRDGADTTNKFVGKFYYCKIYDNGTLVRDFIPVKTSSNAVCLYDRVTQTFFYNGGSGTFTAGNTIGTAPNPDYPQDIHVVTGDVTVNVVGKNLTYTLLTNGGITGSGLTYLRRDNGSIKVTGTTNRAWDYTITKAVKLRAGHTYTFKTTFASGTTPEFLYIQFNSANGGQATANNNNNYTVTRTLVQDQTLSVKWSKSANQTVNFDCTVQIEENSTATTYEPYTEQTQLLSLGSIELAKIGNYTDRIFKDNGKWYVEKNIRKTILDGSDDEPYNMDEVASGTNYRSFNLSIANYVLPNSVCLCNKLSYSTQSIYASDIQGIKPNSTGYYKFKILDSSLTSVSAFRSWIANNNLLIYGIYNTPPEPTEITDTTLIAQLENILAMHTNKNVTNFSIVPTGTNAEPTAEVEYRVDLGTVIGNINNAIISLGGNV